VERDGGAAAESAPPAAGVERKARQRAHYPQLTIDAKDGEVLYFDDGIGD
jgi:hypothetical protein